MTSEAEPVAMGPGATERQDDGMAGSGDEWEAERQDAGMAGSAESAGSGEDRVAERQDGGTAGSARERVAERRDGGMAGSGDERVDAALARLGGLAGTPVAEHVQVFADVHRGLQEVLTALDQEAADGARDQRGGGSEAEAGS